MLYEEKIAVCSDKYTKHSNAVVGKKDYLTLNVQVNARVHGLTGTQKIFIHRSLMPMWKALFFVTCFTNMSLSLNTLPLGLPLK
jgi:hypothetical protein